MSNDARNALFEIANLIIDLVANRGSLGFPSGELYANLMGFMNLETYQKFMDAIVASGKLRQEGFLYFKDN